MVLFLCYFVGEFFFFKQETAYEMCISDWSSDVCSSDLYPCFCTRADIAASLAAPHGPAGAVYPGTCRALDAAEHARRVAGEAHCWRIDMARAVARAGDLMWEEAGQGMRRADPGTHGDNVPARTDDPARYPLSSTLAATAMGGTHVCPGPDL